MDLAASAGMRAGRWGRDAKRRMARQWEGFRNLHDRGCGVRLDLFLVCRSLRCVQSGFWRVECAHSPIVLLRRVGFAAQRRDCALDARQCHVHRRVDEARRGTARLAGVAWGERLRHRAGATRRVCRGAAGPGRGLCCCRRETGWPRCISQRTATRWPSSAFLGRACGGQRCSIHYYVFVCAILSTTPVCRLDSRRSGPVAQDARTCEAHPRSWQRECDRRSYARKLDKQESFINPLCSIQFHLWALMFQGQHLYESSILRAGIDQRSQHLRFNYSDAAFPQFFEGSLDRRCQHIVLRPAWCNNSEQHRWSTQRVSYAQFNAGSMVFRIGGLTPVAAIRAIFLRALSTCCLP